MKGIVYRSAALALACIVALSVLAVPSFATDYQSTYNFWNWAYDNSWFLGKAIIGFSAGNVCQVSEDGLHHATTHSGGGGSVDGQRVYKCVCDLCGQEFQAVATDLEQSYDSYSINNTVNSTSNGVMPTSSNHWYCKYELPYNKADYFMYEDFDYLGGNDYSFQYWLQKYGAGNVHCEFYYSIYFPADIVNKFNLKLASNWSVNGVAASSFYSIYTVNENGSLSTFYDRVYAGESVGCTSGVQYIVEADIAFTSELGVLTTSTFEIDAPVITITGYKQPYSVTYNYLPPSGTTYYNDSTNYSVQNEQPVIDPTEKTIYNPVTNTTTNITNWTYDYSDRSYTCTTENNTTTTITYGDEFITINEGDVNNTYITYNIYYYTAPENSGDGSGSGSDGDGSGSGGSGDSSDDGDGIGGGLGELLGSLLGGLINLITGLISGLIDSLINLVEMTIEKLGQVVNLFGEFGDALKVLWSWLPDEVVTILAAGVSVVVFASVIKLFV